MKDLKVELSQVDKSDLYNIKNIITNGFNSFFDESRDFNAMDFQEWIEDIHVNNPHTFAIRVEKSESGTKNWLVGVCGLREIDWCARHAKILFVMVDKDGHKSTIQNHPATIYSFKLLLKYAFDELGLNKLWINSIVGNDITPVLKTFGFVAEGIRRRAVFSNGKYLDEMVFSLIAKDILDGAS